MAKVPLFSFCGPASRRGVEAVGFVHECCGRVVARGTPPPCTPWAEILRLLRLVGTQPDNPGRVAVASVRAALVPESRVGRQRPVHKGRVRKRQRVLHFGQLLDGQALAVAAAGVVWFPETPAPLAGAAREPGKADAVSAAPVAGARPTALRHAVV
eukprot:CAMPEP_0171704624 /NCGR_PEP_ID=MMETSP0991-20121206/12759_1 /TAXON_ID=483369 /ORGANISM="non described non described, Strain CCMP2098" /LENGTH=155 /DNA_ID=CAMNT_0012294107 /DNA_START=251 /DNA_END=718 /DNA_ORIENTATION=-